MAKEMAKVISEAVSKIQAIASGSTMSANHESPYHLAAKINDNHAQDENFEPKTFVLTLQATVETTSIPNPEPAQTRKRSHCRGQKRKNRNFAMASPQNPLPRPPHATEPARRPYTGDFPQCAICTYHHPTHVPCRLCTTCHKYGHFSHQCRNNLPLANQVQAQPANQNPRPLAIAGRACFICHNPNHLANQCPQRNNPGAPQQAPPPAPRGRAFVLTAAQAQHDNDVVNDIM